MILWRLKFFLNFYDHIQYEGKIEKNDFLQIVSIKYTYYSKIGNDNGNCNVNGNGNGNSNGNGFRHFTIFGSERLGNREGTISIFFWNGKGTTRKRW